MSDRAHSLQVVLESDIREDDVQSLMDAIQHFRGVIDVSAMTTSPESHMAEIRARSEIQVKLFQIAQDL